MKHWINICLTNHVSGWHVIAVLYSNQYINCPSAYSQILRLKKILIQHTLQFQDIEATSDFRSLIFLEANIVWFKNNNLQSICQ